MQTAPATLTCLLAPAALHETQRTRLAPIQQAHFGSRDLLFAGRPYRPDHAGCNLLDDVARLADYLAGIDPSRWAPEDLQPLAELSPEDRADELEFARDWLTPLCEMYQRARQRRQIVVCEAI